MKRRPIALPPLHLEVPMLPVTVRNIFSFFRFIIIILVELQWALVQYLRYTTDACGPIRVYLTFLCDKKASHRAGCSIRLWGATATYILISVSVLHIFSIVNSNFENNLLYLHHLTLHDCLRCRWWLSIVKNPIWPTWSHARWSTVARVAG